VALFSGVITIAGIIHNVSTPSPTLYTLQDIYNLINANATSTAGNHLLAPSSGPVATSSHSVSEIYADLANLIQRENVQNGITYLGIVGEYGVPDLSRPTTTIIYSSLNGTGTPQAFGYTLDDVYNLITNNTTGSASSHSFTNPATPVSSMHTTSDIYNSLIGLINPLKVKGGITYLGRAGTYPPITGGTVTYDGGYTVRTFTSSGTFITPIGLTADILVVAGGGGGGAGGGGAGGLIYSTSTSISAGTTTVTVGTGGVVGSVSAQGGNGENSIFGTLTAIGGGGGGAYNFDGISGGSGGGAGHYGNSGGTSTPSQGNDGGIVIPYGSPCGCYGYQTGGGGGAGAAGEILTITSGFNRAGNGGNGLQINITGTSTYYAGGGGGTSYSGFMPVGNGGLGGGGKGASGSALGFSGTPNTGGGGGGGNTVYGSGAGGSGVVIIRYLTP